MGEHEPTTVPRCPSCKQPTPLPGPRDPAPYPNPARPHRGSSPEMALAQKPMTAERISFLGSSSYWGSTSFR